MKHFFTTHKFETTAKRILHKLHSLKKHKHYLLIFIGLIIILLLSVSSIVFAMINTTREAETLAPSTTPIPTTSPTPQLSPTQSRPSKNTISPTPDKSLGSFTMKVVNHNTGDSINPDDLKVTITKTDGTFTTSYETEGIKTTGSLKPGEYKIVVSNFGGYSKYTGGCSNTTCYWQEDSTCSALIQVKPGENSELLCRYLPQSQSGQTNTNTSAPTSTSSQSSDTTPPTMNMTGPENGSTVSFNNFCFPMHPTDNVSSSSDIQVRVNFDNAGWSPWGNNYAPCYSGVANGQHTFSVEAKDKAGNTTSENRTFTVAS